MEVVVPAELVDAAFDGFDELLHAVRANVAMANTAKEEAMLRVPRMLIFLSRTAGVCVVGRNGSPTPAAPLTHGR